MRNFILMTAVVALLGACSPHRNVDNSKQGSLDTSAVVERVEEIYTTVFNVYNEEDSLRNLDIHMENGVYERRADFEANYCSNEWNTLLKKVNEIDSLYHQNEMGFWDFDYWIMGQDWHKLSISDVKFVEGIGPWAEVDLKLHNFDKVTPLCLVMKLEDGTWRIDDFVDLETGAGLKEDMKKYIANETAEAKKK